MAGSTSLLPVPQRSCLVLRFGGWAIWQKGERQNCGISWFINIYVYNSYGGFHKWGYFKETYKFGQFWGGSSYEPSGLLLCSWQDESTALHSKKGLKAEPIYSEKSKHLRSVSVEFPRLYLLILQNVGIKRPCALRISPATPPTPQWVPQCCCRLSCIRSRNEKSCR